MRPATSYLETSFIDGQKNPKVEIKRIDRLRYRVVSASKVLSAIIHLQILWMVLIKFKSFKIIAFSMSESNLINGVDYKIITQGITAG